MFEKIKDYFRNRYILKTFRNTSYEINFTDLDFTSILKKYDLKTNFDDKLLFNSILSVACELKSGTEDEILCDILYLYLDNLKESFNVSNRVKYLELCKLKVELKYTENKKNNLLDLSFLEEISEFSPLYFSKDNFDSAMNCIQNLIENNEKHINSLYLSYKTLRFSKTSIELAFNYLLDSVGFDKNSPVFKDKDFTNNLKGLHMSMLLTYLNVDFNEIPTDRIEQVRFSSSKKIDFGKNQLEITQLINWRNKEQWLYSANAFGLEDPLGKLCLQKSESI
ncbi:MAG: hypothetical protein ACYC01_01905 [Lutibacter sp.]